MSLIETLSTDIRARADYLPFCPDCSFLGKHDSPDILIGPSLRQFKDRFKFVWCCKLSETTESFQSKYEAAVWWRDRRLQEHSNPSITSKRKNTLKKLSDAGLEPIVQ